MATNNKRPNAESRGAIAPAGAFLHSAKARAIGAAAQDKDLRGMRARLAHVRLAHENDAIRAGTKQCFAYMMGNLARYGLSSIEDQGMPRFEACERFAILDGIKNILDLISEKPIIA